MPKFVARPSAVEALQWLGKPLPDAFQRVVVRLERDGACTVQAWDGLRLCKYRDWIVRDGDGEFSVMRDSKFESLFVALVSSDAEPERVKRPYHRRMENVEA